MRFEGEEPVEAVGMQSSNGLDDLTVTCAGDYDPSISGRTRLQPSQPRPTPT